MSTIAFELERIKASHEKIRTAAIALGCKVPAFSNSYGSNTTAGRDLVDKNDTLSVPGDPIQITAEAIADFASKFADPVNGGGTATADKILAPYTAYTSSGFVTGTIPTKQSNSDTGRYDLKVKVLENATGETYLDSEVFHLDAGYYPKGITVNPYITASVSDNRVINICTDAGELIATKVGTVYSGTLPASVTGYDYFKMGAAYTIRAWEQKAVLEAVSFTTRNDSGTGDTISVVIGTKTSGWLDGPITQAINIGAIPSLAATISNSVDANGHYKVAVTTSGYVPVRTILDMNATVLSLTGPTYTTSALTGSNGTSVTANNYYVKANTTTGYEPGGNYYIQLPYFQRGTANTDNYYKVATAGMISVGEFVGTKLLSTESYNPINQTNQFKIDKGSVLTKDFTIEPVLVKDHTWEVKYDTDLTDADSIFEILPETGYYMSKLTVDMTDILEYLLLI